MKKETEYKALEQQIIELWESRGWKVLTEKVETLKGNEVKWTIVAIYEK